MEIRIFVQISSLILAVFCLAILLVIKIKHGSLPNEAAGIISLLLHISIFYFFVIMGSVGGPNLITFLNDTLGVQCFSFGTWSSAIRLQTVIELVLMVLTITRRRLWTLSALK